MQTDARQPATPPRKDVPVAKRAFFAVIGALCLYGLIFSAWASWDWFHALVTPGSVMPLWLFKEARIIAVLFGTLLLVMLHLMSTFAAVSSFNVVRNRPERKDARMYLFVGGAALFLVGVYKLVQTFPFRVCIADGSWERFRACWQVYSTSGFSTDMTAAIVVIGWMPVLGMLLVALAFFLHKKKAAP